MKKIIKETAERTKHTINALKSAKSNGGIKNIERTKHGTQYNYKNGTGYWVEK